MGPPILFNWATAESNYPAGGNPWSATPVNVAPVGDIFTPNTKPGAQNLNYILNKIASATSRVYAWGAGPIQFLPSYAPRTAALATLSCHAFDPITLKWMIAGNAPSTGDVAVVWGRGSDNSDMRPPISGAITSTATPSSICRGIEPGTSPPNRYIYVGTVLSNAGFLTRVDPTGNTSGTNALVDNANVTQVVVLSTSGTIIIATAATSSADTHISKSTDSGTTVTGVISFTVPINGWLAAQSVIGAGTTMLIPTNPGGRTSGSMMEVYTTTDGISWTITGVVGVVGGSEIPTSLCYGADGSGVPCWILTTNNGGTPAVYRSYDGTSWASIASTLTTLGVPIIDMASIGGAYVAIVGETPARMLYSMDGAATFLSSSSGLANTGADDGLVVSSYTQFMALCAGLVLPSFSYGPSVGLGGP